MRTVDAARGRKKGEMMARSVCVYGLPSEIKAEELAGGTVVVIDVLRASTTIVHALAAGALGVIPCEEIEDARTRAAEFPEGQVILGGERFGLPIDGFHLGNSPDEYTPATVQGRTVVFTTTNGTRAMAKCRQAARVLIGAFVNAGAILNELAGCQRIHLLCAGTRGEVGRDDMLMAGLLVDRLSRHADPPRQFNALAITAREQWKSLFSIPAGAGSDRLDPGELAEQLSNSQGGRNLKAIGLEKDILAAARIDRLAIAPELDLKTLRIQ
jgi:2-phosphosulfolactate phosphatase